MTVSQSEQNKPGLSKEDKERNFRVKAIHVTGRGGL
jgi:hypothetical protein